MNVFDASRVEGEVPVKPSVREVRGLQLGGLWGAALGGRALLLPPQMRPEYRGGGPELRVEHGAHMAHAQLQLELPVVVREVPSVQLVHRQVVPVTLGRAFRRELHLRKTDEKCQGSPTVTIQ